MSAKAILPRHRLTAQSVPAPTHVALLLVAAALVACGGGDGSAEAAGGSSGGAGTKASEERESAGRDACSLITAEQVAAIAGAPVVARSEPGSRESGCDYSDQSGELVYLGLKVYWEGGREMLDIVQSGINIAAGLMAEGGDEALVDSIVRPGPVVGLGDVALFSDILPSYVLSGDVLLEIYLQLLPNARQHFRPLAHTALARL